MVPSQPLTFSVPVPLAMRTPLQKNLYSPVWALINTKLPGLVSSCRQKLNTVTGKLQDDLLPQLSVAVQLTVVVPTGKGEPEGGLQTIVGVPPQLSVAVTVKLTGLPVAIAHEAAATEVTPPGQVITGGVVSTKVMCCTHVLMLLQASVAFHVRSMPGLPVQLGGVAASVKLMVGVPPQLSVAVAVPVFAGAVESPHCNCLSGGQVITGGVVSTNVMCCTQVLILPHPSVAFHVRSIPGLPVQLGGVAASVKLIVTG
jgi:hypothetical protein